jgi:2-polyprenyl-3-methyl-5-hydroxy-6-metoxy-1,4-benzoquinol methylase
MTHKPFTDQAAREAWDRGAEAWQAFVRSGADYYRTHVHGPALLEVAGAQAGWKVMDVGCGEGYFARELARQGARVTAIDLSPAQVEAAREEEEREPLGIDFRVMNGAEMAGLGEASYRLVTSCMALQDMSDPEACLASAHRVLEPGGRMVFSVPHPCTDTVVREWDRDASGRKLALRIDRYFESGPAECDWSMPRLAYRWQTPFWRRTLTEWTAMISRAGFLIGGLTEPRPRADQLERLPELDDCARVPYFLILDLLKLRHPI